MRVALVYDRVNKWGGAERMLLALHEIFPKAPLYTSVYSEKNAPWAKKFSEVITSFLQKIPFVKTRHEMLGTITPLAFEQFDFAKYDLVISVTSESAKGIIVRPPTKHLCYMLTPTRYLWSGYENYFKNPLFKMITKPAVSYLRYWDQIAAQRPDRVIAVSTEVKRRIKKYYNRDSTIIFPPVEIQKFQSPAASHQPPVTNYYLVVSRLVYYKRVDLAIRAFNKIGKPLIIVGSGRQEGSLRLMAKSNITFTKNLTDKELAGYYHNARALIMPQAEDFGLVSVEAQAVGTPVIAFKSGGALDTIIKGKTGVFFNKQGTSSLIRAIERFEKIKINEKDCQKSSQRFSKKRFEKEFRAYVNEL